MMNDFRTNGPLSQIAAQLERHEKAIREILATAAPTQNLLLPFGVYGTISPMAVSPSFPFSATIDRDMTLVKWAQTWYVSTTNDGGNFWTIKIEKVDGTEIVSMDTAVGVPDTFTLDSLVAFTVGTLSSADVGIRLRCTKAGAPGSLSLLGPILEYSG